MLFAGVVVRDESVLAVAGLEANASVGIYEAAHRRPGSIRRNDHGRNVVPVTVRVAG